MRNSNVRKIAGVAHIRKASTSTQLSLGLDPSDIAQHAHALHHHAHVTSAAASDPTSILDSLSSFTLAKASSILPNQSVAPLPETIQPPENMLEVIPDMPSMPGGVPRSGNAFLSGSFRDLYKGAWTSQSMNSQASWSDVSGDGTLVVPARELDAIARYADLLARIPLAATVYALVDFFLINAEEDVAIAELFEEDAEVEAIVEVENMVVMQRLVGLLVVVAATVAWSLLTYHPVPLGEL